MELRQLDLASKIILPQRISASQRFSFSLASHNSDWHRVTHVGSQPKILFLFSQLEGEGESEGAGETHGLPHGSVRVRASACTPLSAEGDDVCLWRFEL